MKLLEFDELNACVSEMTKRVSSDFEALKTFADNASHEMQTPLAIINSKLDILVQTSTEKDAEQLQAIYNATNRLTRLNQTLLLLTKINNEQYSSQSKINLKKLLVQKLQHFDELIKGRNIQLSCQLEDVFITINEALVEILLNNLLSNAIKHNIIGGSITCMLNATKLSITNSGPPLTFDKQNMFERFQKSNHSDGTGLGLSVVKQICDSSNLIISYTNGNNYHTFSILFS